MTKTKIALAALATMAVAPFAYADGRAPTADETVLLKAAMTSHGFSSWSKIEFDDGKWEVDNAKHSDGKTYDLDLAAADLAVIKKDLDD